MKRPVATKIIMGTVMLARMRRAIPFADMHEQFCFPRGVPIETSDILGEDRGAVQYSDGTVELFGDWDSVPSETVAARRKTGSK